jgi:hypothetical protein
VNLNQRECGSDDLRKIVIEAVLDSGDQGIDSFAGLLEKAAARLNDRRDGAAASRPPSPEPRFQLRPGESDRVVEIVWDLAREGILTFAPHASNAEQPGLRYSRFGGNSVRNGPDRSPKTTGFMKAWCLEAAEISPDTVVYLREAVKAFYMDRLLSSCVVLAVAVEGEFLKLLGAAKNSPVYGQWFARIGDGPDLGGRIAQFKDAITPILKHFPRSATVELDHNLEMMRSVMRIARNETGQPSGVLPPSREQVYLTLQFFIPFARQAKRLRQELSEPPYPRLVRQIAVSVAGHDLTRSPRLHSPSHL